MKPESFPEKPKTNLRVAVIDDDEAVTFYLNALLPKRGCQPYAFLSPREALLYFQNAYKTDQGKSPPFDLILVDFKMPELDGLKLTHRIHELYPKLPIVIMTAHASIDVALKAGREGIFDFLEKPISIFKLSGILKTISQQEKTKLQAISTEI